MTDDKSYYGRCPSGLRVEYRADGAVRFRVQQLGGFEALVDLEGELVDKLVEDLAKRGES